MYVLWYYENVCICIVLNFYNSFIKANAIMYDGETSVIANEKYKI